MNGVPDTPDTHGVSKAGEESDLLRQALSAYSVARTDPAAAVSYVGPLVAAAEREPDPEALVVALRAAAWAAREMQDSEPAQRYINRAARVARVAGLTTRCAEALVDRAAIAMEAGRSRAAVHDLSEAEAMFDGDVPAEWFKLTAVRHQNCGRLTEAAAIYRRLLQQPGLQARDEASAANNLALIACEIGNPSEALKLIARARGAAEAAGPATHAYATLGQAWVTAKTGRLPDSVGLFAEAEKLFATADLPAGVLHVEFADVMIELRLLPEAREAAYRAADELEAAGVRLMQAEAQLMCARTSLLAGRPAEAEVVAERALRSFRQQQRIGWAAQAALVEVDARRATDTVRAHDLVTARRAARALDRLGLVAEAVQGHLTAGQLAIHHGRREWALLSLDRAQVRARRGPVGVRLHGRLAAAIAASLRADQDTAMRHCREGLNDLDRHRDRLGSSELRARASAHGDALGGLGLGLLVRSADPPRVLKWMERTRAAALTSAYPSSVRPADSDADLAELHELQDQLDRDPQAPAEMREARTDVEERLRRGTWTRSSAPSTHSARPTFGELRERIGDRVLVEFAVSDGWVVAVVLSHGPARLVTVCRLAECSAQVERIFFSLRSLSLGLSTRSTSSHLQGVRERVRHLRRLLIEPLEIPSDRELVVVPVGILQRVPWVALHDAPVSLGPSASLWAVTRERVAAASPGSGSQMVLVAGPDLPGAMSEVETLARLHPDPRVLCPPDSTVEAVVEAVRGSSTAHFACHGRMRADNPVFSGLRLSDGLLTVQELELRELAPYRVLLSACEAGSDLAVPGNETIGFVSALMARGTAGVLGSLLLAPDIETGGLMERVHRQLLGGATLAVALHAAREDLDLADPPDLVNWCGLTVFGAA